MHLWVQRIKWLVARGGLGGIRARARARGILGLGQGLGAEVREP